jgi:hypothetical protein
VPQEVPRLFHFSILLKRSRPGRYRISSPAKEIGTHRCSGT